MPSFGFSVLSALVAGLLVAACADGAGRPIQGGSGLLNSDIRSYRLGIGDKLRVTVYGEQDLSGQFEIGPQGAIGMPLIGEIPAKGRMPQDIRDAVAAKLASGYLKNPRVTVDVVAYRPFYVHGEVRSGGEFPYKSGMRVRDAVALAGGYTYRANQGHILLQRDGTEGEVRIALPSEIFIMPGDNIRVPERFF
jgi:polysaccharide export outer membrane protein